MKTLIVVPTYNEAQNIKEFIPLVFKAIGEKWEVDILVVDDNSPDGTAEIVQKLKKETYTSRLHILKRERKLGLGTAYIAGFKWGFQKDYNLFIEMDADFSHNPATLPNMIEKTDTYDFIIGSRYVSGGGVKGWGLIRKFISLGGSLYAKTILGIPIHDLTGGYNLWKKDVLMGIDLNRVRSEGYAFQIELKYKAFKKGFKHLEYPIIFQDRFIGKSKMSRRIFIEAIIRVWQLKLSSFLK